MNITVTQPAVEFLNDLLNKIDDSADDGRQTNIKVYVERGGTPLAETALTYCKEEDKGDVTIMPFNGFDLYVENKSSKFLEECVIDYDVEKFGGQLTIKAPNSKTSKLDENSTLEEKVNYYLYNAVNPMLAQHGGQVTLSEITEDKIVVLEFGGGCQGCAAVDMTLNAGIEQILKDKVPEVTGIRDITDHTYREIDYYQGAQADAGAFGGF